MTRTLLASLVVALPQIAAAQPGYAPAPPGYYAQPAPIEGRHGFLIGFSLGGGAMTCDKCDSLSGVALDIHLGGMISPQVGLMFDGSGVGHALDGGGTLIHVVDTFAVQYWVAPQFWIKGGVGVGRLSLNDDRGNEVLASDTGAAAMGAVGFELVSSRSFAIDLQLRGSVAHYKDNISMGTLTVGANWY